MFQVHRKVRPANLFRMQMELVCGIEDGDLQRNAVFHPCSMERQRSKLGATFCRNINKGVVEHDAFGNNFDACEKYEL